MLTGYRVILAWPLGSDRWWTELGGAVAWGNHGDGGFGFESVVQHKSRSELMDELQSSANRSLYILAQT